MAFSPLEYCRLFAQKKAYQGGGVGVTGTPGPPLATPLLLKIQIHVGSLKSGSIFRASRKVSVEYMNAEKRFRPKMF